MARIGENVHVYGRYTINVQCMLNRVYTCTLFHDVIVLQYSSVDSAAEAHPHIDYTPPHYITLLFTDLGVLTPSAVSDELIKLYQ